MYTSVLIQGGKDEQSDADDVCHILGTLWKTTIVVRMYMVTCMLAKSHDNKTVAVIKKVLA